MMNIFKAKGRVYLVRIILLVGIALFLNLNMINFFTRVDLTRQGIYSISDASRQTVASLSDKLVVKAYFSSDLQGDIATTRQYTLDLLTEYEAYAGGMMSFEFVDPTDKEKFKEQAQKNGLSPLTMRVNERDKLEIREVYLGLAFLYQNKSEVMPVVSSTRGLEYQITTTIKRLTQQKSNKVAFFAPEPKNLAQGQQPPYSQAKQHLGELYDLETVQLEKAVDADVLIMAGVTDSLTALQLINVDQFLMRGGNLVVFQERVNADLQQQRATAIKSNFIDLLDHYQLGLADNLVTDEQCGEINVQQRQGFFLVNRPIKYPFFPIIQRFNTDSPIMEKSSQIQLVFASSIDSTKVGKNTKFTPLFYSSAHSGLATGPYYNISYQRQNWDLSQGPKVVAALYEGGFTTNFKPAEKNEAHKDSTATGKILLVGDSDFIANNAGIGVPANVAFLQNSIDYLSGDSGMIALRSREVSFSPLKDISAPGRSLVKWLNILLPSFLMLLLGLIIWRREVVKRKRIGEIYER